MRDPVQIALRCQDAGARVLTLHPRTRTQMYTGHARWDEIAAVVAGARHSGDRQRRHQDGRGRASACASTPAAPAIMIARGSYGQPWIFAPGARALDGRRVPAPPRSRSGSRSRSSTRAWRIEYETDPRGAAIEFRKHLGWYAKGLPDGADLRRRLLRRERVLARWRASSATTSRHRGVASLEAHATPAPATTTGARSRRPRRESRARARRCCGRVADGAGRRRGARIARAGAHGVAAASPRSTTTARSGRATRRSSSAQGKTSEQIVAIAERIADRGDGVLVTRAWPTTRAARCSRRFPALEHQRARRARVLLRPARAAQRGARDRPDRHRGHERPAGGRRGRGDRARAWGTAWSGSRDVGVAGIHRVLRGRDALDARRRGHRRRRDGRRAAVRRRRAGARAR